MCVVRCWSQDQSLYTSTDRLVFPSRRQVVGGKQSSRRAVAQGQAVCDEEPDRVCLPIHRTKFPVGLMVTVLIILTAF